MHPSATLRILLLALLVAIVAAAPAPVYGPKPPAPWVTGREKPVDPLGDCHFPKSGDEL